jgi:hypothetical protein
MTADAHLAPPGSPPPDKSLNVFQRFAGVLFAPADTFRDIARRPDILGPLLIILLIGYATTAVVMQKMDFTTVIEQQAGQMRKQNPNMDEEQLQQMERLTMASMKVFGWISPLIMVAWYALVALVLMFAFRLFGGEGTYKQAFSVTLYAWVPLILFGILMTVIVLARGSFDPATAATLVKSNLAFLVDMTEQPVLFSLLSSFDIFTIWTIALLSIGFGTVFKTSTAKAAAIVVSLWIAMIFVKVGFAALSASRMK